MKNRLKKDLDTRQADFLNEKSLNTSSTVKLLTPSEILALRDDKKRAVKIALAHFKMVFGVK